MSKLLILTKFLGIKLILTQTVLALSSFNSSFVIYQNTSVGSVFKYNYFIETYQNSANKIKCITFCNQNEKCNSFTIYKNSNATFDCSFFSSDPFLKNDLFSINDSSLYVKSIGKQLPFVFPMSYIESDYVTNWGDWRDNVFCPTNSYAIGFSIKVDLFDILDLLDLSGLNAMDLVCSDLANTRIKSGEAGRGSWTPTVYCPYGKS